MWLTREWFRVDQLGPKNATVEEGALYIVLHLDPPINNKQWRSSGLSVVLNEMSSDGRQQHPEL
jgi:hypothetical protein